MPPAIRDAKENAVRNGIENAEFFCGDAADIAARLEAEGLRPDVVTVDPPRKGLAPEVIASVAAMGPEKVVYVSCDPATLGRDVKLFGQLGYQAVRAAAVDMFPGTAHIEAIVFATKRNLVEILRFTLFSRHVVFDGEGDKLRNKRIENHITVSVVIDMECGNTKN